MIQITFANSEADIINSYAASLGYQPTVIVSPATPATMAYDANNNPVDVPAQAEVDGQNPQSASDFVTAYLQGQILSAYKANLMALAVAAAQAQVEQQIANL